MASIQLFMSRVSGSGKVKMEQAKMKNVLESKKIDYEEVDISSDEDQRNFMKENSKSDNKGLVPQLFKDGQYIGNYDDFFNAVEDDMLEEFLQLVDAKQKSVAQLTVQNKVEPEEKKDEEKEDGTDEEVQAENATMSESQPSAESTKEESAEDTVTEETEDTSADKTTEELTADKSAEDQVNDDSEELSSEEPDLEKSESKPEELTSEEDEEEIEKVPSAEKETEDSVSESELKTDGAGDGED